MFKHLLVPLDGSNLAEKALPAALELAQKFDSVITLLSVTEMPHIIAGAGSRVETKMVVDLRERAQHEALTYIQNLEHSLTEQGVAVKGQVSPGIQVADTILDVVQAVKADTIVMSTHGRTGLSRWVYGSIAEKLLRHATVPVLLIRSQE